MYVIFICMLTSSILPTAVKNIIMITKAQAQQEQQGKFFMIMKTRGYYDEVYNMTTNLKEFIFVPKNSKIEYNLNEITAHVGENGMLYTFSVTIMIIGLRSD
jgi:hypothetical protein